MLRTVMVDAGFVQLSYEWWHFEYRASRDLVAQGLGTFTVRDAKRGGMWLNSYKKPWLQYPDRMLYNRASAAPGGEPWSERKAYVWWDAERGRWRGGRQRRLGWRHRRRLP